MTELNKIYKCDICGNIVQVVHKGAGALVCCGEVMSLLEEQTADYKLEKHVPIIIKKADGYLVQVGSTMHPMTQEHYIEWIELVADGVSYRKYLKPGDKPEAFFCIDADNVNAREYCNLHKLWLGDK
jgi:superoxide reductase